MNYEFAALQSTNLVTLQQLYDNLDNYSSSESLCVCGIVYSTKFQVIHSKSGKLFDFLEIYIYDSDIHNLALYQYWGDNAGDYLRFHVKRGYPIVIHGFQVKLIEDELILHKLSENEHCGSTSPNNKQKSGLLRISGGSCFTFNDSDHRRMLLQAMLPKLFETIEVLSSKSMLNVDSFVKEIRCNSFTEALYIKSFSCYTMVLRVILPSRTLQDFHSSTQTSLKQVVVEDSVGNKASLNFSSEKSKENFRLFLQRHIQVLTIDDPSIQCSRFFIDRAYRGNVKAITATENTHFDIFSTIFYPESNHISCNNIQPNDSFNANEGMTEETIELEELLEICRDSVRLQHYQGKKVWVKASIVHIQCLYHDVSDATESNLMLSQFIQINRRQYNSDTNGDVMEDSETKEVHIQYKPAVMTITSPSNIIRQKLPLAHSLCDTDTVNSVSIEELILSGHINRSIDTSNCCFSQKHHSLRYSFDVDRNTAEDQHSLSKQLSLFKVHSTLEVDRQGKAISQPTDNPRNDAYGYIISRDNECLSNDVVDYCLTSEHFLNSNFEVHAMNVDEISQFSKDNEVLTTTNELRDHTVQVDKPLSKDVTNTFDSLNSNVSEFQIYGNSFGNGKSIDLNLHDNAFVDIINSNKTTIDKNTVESQNVIVTNFGNAVMIYGDMWQKLFFNIPASVLAVGIAKQHDYRSINSSSVLNTIQSQTEVSPNKKQRIYWSIGNSLGLESVSTNAINQCNGVHNRIISNNDDCDTNNENIFDCDEMYKSCVDCCSICEETLQSLQQPYKSNDIGLYETKIPKEYLMLLEFQMVVTDEVGMIKITNDALLTLREISLV